MVKVKQPDGNEFFRETSGFAPWLKILVFSSSLIPLPIALIHLRSNPREMYWLLGLELVLALVMYILFMGMRLELVISSRGVFYRMRPLHAKYRAYDVLEIESATIDKDPALGYGIKKSGMNHKALKMNEGKGLRLNLKDGKSVFFSTRNEEALTGAVSMLQSYIKRSSIS